MVALLGQRSVVNDQVSVSPADQIIASIAMNLLDWLGLPLRHGDEMMQLLLVTRRNAFNNGLDALAVTWKQ